MQQVVVQACLRCVGATHNIVFGGGALLPGSWPSVVVDHQIRWNIVQEAIHDAVLSRTIEKGRFVNMSNIGPRNL